MACTLLLSRRLYPEAGSFRLGALADFHAIAPAGRAHRALADAEVAAGLLAQIQCDLRDRYEVEDAPHELLLKLQRTPRKALPKAIASYFESLRA